jgi:hypothetical protein
LTPAQLISENSRELEGLLREKSHKIRSAAMECINSVLSSAGLEFDWKGSPERFEDFIEDVDTTNTVKAELLRLNDIYDEASVKFALQYECIYEYRKGYRETT